MPENVFSSPAAEIKLIECDIRSMKKNAISALEVYSVQIANTTFSKIASGAFSDRSLLHNLELGNVSIRQMLTGAILSAVTNFTFNNSK